DADSMLFADAPVAGELLRYRDVDFAPTASFTHLPEALHDGDRVIVWADAGECVRRFGVERPLRQCHLFYFAFRRSPATAALFDTARRVYRELQAEPLPSMRRWYGGRVSAELAMSIATGLVDFSLYSPAHVPVMNNHMAWWDGAGRHHLGFTFCGRPPDAAWITRYDAVAVAATPGDAVPIRWSGIEP
ncbi:MAG: hypothetical protein KDC48_18435, partial [Planctomycetes bacterium]|nr:hypothetical protein [Planctomycetota bacterium]